MCVNALKGATLISTSSLPKTADFSDLCQCPERGDTHFYTCLREPA